MRLLIDLDDDIIQKLRKKSYDLNLPRKRVIEKIVVESLKDST